MKSHEIRSKFVEYFKSLNHKHLPSGPLVPENDPSLMFANSGMVQFKDIFTGRKEPPEVSDVVTVQKCLRAGGKHNDLEEVGTGSVRHFSFFEMLGNFSFGGYFKREAIAYAWEFITGEDWLNINVHRLYATVHVQDKESYDLWRDYLPTDRIIEIETDDNFWSMGDTGPCGYCSEIFYDYGDEYEGGLPGTPDEDGGRYVEIWNLVFMQFECTEKGQAVADMKELPMKCIDTGMGLERITAVMQGKQDNYETDLFKSMIDRIAENTGKPDSPSHRVIADHVRAIAFMISEGIVPSNEGRDYVLRRIMRRMMRHLKNLKVDSDVFAEIFYLFAAKIYETYPELLDNEENIIRVFEKEFKAFGYALGQGMKILNEKMETLRSGDTLDGQTAFLLYDTYGFPLDLTQDILRAKDMDVDMKGFNESMERQKNLSRPLRDDWGLYKNNPVWQEIYEKHGATEFQEKTKHALNCEILGFVADTEKQYFYVVFDKTNIYGESGGQIGDTGNLTNYETRTSGKILNAWKTGDGIIVHQIELLQGELKKGDKCDLGVNKIKNQMISCNHSTTHLLHFALRRILGDHVQQKGSKITDTGLRFDFSHPGPMTDDEILKVQNEVNWLIREVEDDIKFNEMPIEEAKQQGYTALFGEKYGDVVRTVRIGPSKELCGGTHVNNTADIGAFKITKETSVSSGVRRIKALTGDLADNHIGKKSPAETRKKKQKIIHPIILDSEPVEDINGTRVKFQAKHYPTADIGMNDLKSIADQVKTALETGIAVVGCVNDKGKTMLVVGVTTSLTDRYNARDIFAATGLKGGGRPDLAQGGGDIDLETVFNSIRNHIKKGNTND